MGPVLKIQLLKRSVMNYGLLQLIFFFAACRCTGGSPAVSIPLFSPPDFSAEDATPTCAAQGLCENHTSQASQPVEQHRTWRAYLIAGAAPLTPVHTYHQAVWPLVAV